MKMNFKHVSVAMATMALLLTGCSNEETMPQVVDEGKPTGMTLSITFPTSADTRATYDENATAAEAEIKGNVDVFVYNQSGALIKHQALTIADFAAVENGSGVDRYNSKSTSTIAVTTGTRNVYVGINLPSTLATTLKSKSESELATAVQTLTRANMTSLTAGLPMFSTAAVSSTFKADPTDPANTVTVKVQRMVAKVTVEKSASMTQTGEGTLGNLEFAVNNFNTKTFMMQGATPTFKDPNWTTASYAAADFTAAVAADYTSVVETKSNIKDLVAQYASENTSEMKTKKELTRVTVRATFIPAKYMEQSGSDYVEKASAENGHTAAKTFYTYTPSGKATACFFSKSVADGYAIANGGAASDVLTYTDGYCYWDMFLNKGTDHKGAQWDVVRNEFFRCTITRIIVPGKNTPDIKDPDVQPDEDTLIKVNVEIQNWNTPVLANYELEP